MSDELPFEPRPGPVGDQNSLPAQAGLTVLSALARRGLARRPGPSRLKPGAVRAGRGSAAAAMARHSAHAGQRRAVVTVHIAPAGTGGHAAFTRHLAYIQREGSAPDGSRSPLYGRDGAPADAGAFGKRARQDARQFRLVVSPEDGALVKDLTGFTARLMDRAEKDLGIRLDWVAVNHHDTAFPHVHIVIRGGSRSGGLIIDRNYLTHGFRQRAREELTLELGRRRQRDITAGLSLDTGRAAFTALDGELLRAAPAGRLDLSAPPGVLDRFSAAARIRRLTGLRQLGLATHVFASRWQLKEGWDRALQALGRRTEILETLVRAAGHRTDPEYLRDVSALPAPGGEITGRLAAILPAGAARGGAAILVEDLYGHAWTADIPDAAVPGLPAAGGVITLTASVPGPAPRSGDGAPERSLTVQVRSWLPVEDLVGRRARTWLDTLSPMPPGTAGHGFGADLASALAARQAWIAKTGLALHDAEALDKAELQTAISQEAARRAGRYVELTGRAAFRGVYTGHLDLAQGRFAVIAAGDRFTLAPWTARTAPLQGREVTLQAGGRTLRWLTGPGLERGG